MFARWSVVAAVTVGLLAGCGGPKPTRVSAEEMAAAYVADVPDGDKRYSNRPVIVTGKVEGVVLQHRDPEELAQARRPPDRGLSEQPAPHETARGVVPLEQIVE